MHFVTSTSNAGNHLLDPKIKHFLVVHAQPPEQQHRHPFPLYTIQCFPEVETDFEANLSAGIDAATIISNWSSDEIRAAQEEDLGISQVIQELSTEQHNQNQAVNAQLGPPT